MAVMPAAAASSSSSNSLTPQLRKLVLQTFTKKYSLQLHASALAFIATTLAEHDLLHVPLGDVELEESQREAIEVLAKGCLDLSVIEEAESGSGSIVTAKQLHQVYSQLVADGTSATTSGDTHSPHAGHHESILDDEGAPPLDRWFDVVDSFQLPRVQWDSVARTFVK